MYKSEEQWEQNGIDYKEWHNVPEKILHIMIMQIIQKNVTHFHRKPVRQKGHREEE